MSKEFKNKLITKRFNTFSGEIQHDINHDTKNELIRISLLNFNKEKEDIQIIVCDFFKITSQHYFVVDQNNCGFYLINLNKKRNKKEIEFYFGLLDKSNKIIIGKSLVFGIYDNKKIYNGIIKEVLYVEKKNNFLYKVIGLTSNEVEITVLIHIFVN